MDIPKFRSAWISRALESTISSSESDELIGELVQADVVDIDTLSQLTWHFGVPDEHRPLVWKLILHILPPYRHTWGAVSKIAAERYQDFLASSDALLPVALRRDLDVSNPVKNLECARFAEEMIFRQVGWSSAISLGSWDLVFGEWSLPNIVQVLLGTLSNESDAFWCLTQMLHGENNRNLSEDGTKLDKLARYSAQLLGHHDPDTFKSIEESNVDMHNVIKQWMECGFESCSTSSSIFKLWDCIVARELVFVCYFAGALFCEALSLDDEAVLIAMKLHSIERVLVTARRWYETDSKGNTIQLTGPR